MNICCICTKDYGKKEKGKGQINSFFLGIKQNEKLTISGLFAELDEEQCLIYT